MLRAIAAWFNARRRVVAFVLLAWVALVVIGAGRTPRSDEWIVLPNLSAVLVVVLLVLALAGLVVLLMLRRDREKGFREKPGLSVRAFFLGAIVFAAIAIAFGPREFAEQEGPVLPDEIETLQIGDGTPVADQPSGTQGGDIAALVLIVLVVAAVLLRGRRRVFEAPPELAAFADEELEEDLVAAVARASEQLNLGTRPRMAVLEAYASLERSLAAHGQARRPAETRTEHLTRVLAVVPVLTEPAVRLARLYEIARFSDHPITDDDRDQAAAALARAQRSLMASEA